jgi:hypothetical protein
MARRGQGKLKRILVDDDENTSNNKNDKSNRANTINQGRGQIVTGVTLPAEVNICIYVCLSSTRIDKLNP